MTVCVRVVTAGGGFFHRWAFTRLLFGDMVPYELVALMIKSVEKAADVLVSVCSTHLDFLWSYTSCLRARVKNNHNNSGSGSSNAATVAAVYVVKLDSTVSSMGNFNIINWMVGIRSDS